MRGRRTQEIGDFGRPPAAGFPGGMGQLYGFALLLLVLAFFLLVFQGRTPRVLDRVFTPPPTVDEASLQARRELVATWMDGAWHDPKDGASFAETPGYVRILRKLTDNVNPGDIVDNPPLFDRALAMSSPELQRGEIVKVRGVVARHWAQKLDQPVFQLTDVWRVIVADTEGEDAVVVDVVDRPPQLTEQRDVVEIAAHFYRLVDYEAQKGHVQVPYLMARSLAIVPEARPSGPGFDDPAMLVVVIGIGAMVAWGVLRVVHSRTRARRTIRWRAPHLS